MNYLGGKHRQGKKIAEIISNYLYDGCTYIEPFCGAMGVAYRIVDVLPHECELILSDSHKSLIVMWDNLINKGWNPPSVIDEETYQTVRKYNDENDPMTAYCGFGMSFGSKWWGGYARNNRGTNYALNLQRSTLLKAKTLLKCCDYNDYINEVGKIFYLDPPYSGRTKQSKFKFSHDKFWDFTRYISKNNVVFVTEFVFPDDFRSIYNFGDTVVRHQNSKGKDGTCEHIITMIGGKADVKIQD